MTPEKARDRIDKLIALALGNPNEEEARTAALAALRLMKRFNVQLVMPRPARPAPPPTPPMPDVPDLSEILRRSNEMYERVRQQQDNERREDRERAYREAQRRGWAPPGWMGF